MIKSEFTNPSNRFAFDHLESRELLSYTVQIAGDHLQLTGTDGRECLYITQQPSQVEIRPFCRGERATRQVVPGVFGHVEIATYAGDDKVVLKGFTAADIDIVLGDGSDTVRYYDTIADEFCVDLGAGNDVAKARRNRGAEYMLDGGRGSDSLTSWANNKWDVSDITAVEHQGTFKNGKIN